MNSLSISHPSITRSSGDRALVLSMASEIDKPNSAKRVAVVGAGISGLAAAYRLKSNGVNVTLFEADKKAGGKIRTVAQDGLIWDEGANTMTETEMEVTELIDDLGLRDKQQFPISQDKRYVAKNGSPLLIPASPIALIQSNILSAQSKLQMILEPFTWRKRQATEQSGGDASESVGEFFERHFGKELVDNLIDPFLAGTCGGDPESVSMRHMFPDLWSLEKRFGSIISGAIQSQLSAKMEKSGGTKHSQEKKKRQRGSFSFQGGMQTLIDTVCKQFGEDELKLQSKVLSLSYSHDMDSQLKDWSVSYASNGKHAQALPFDAVVMTAPVSDLKQMEFKIRGNPFSLDFLPEVNYLPVSLMITTFKKANVKRPLEGFGVLIPSKERSNGLKTLGTLFSSMMFPDRSPSDLYLYTTFIGGSRDRELAKASTDELKQIVSSDLQQLLGAEGEPHSLKHVFWSKAFPLYGRNYDIVLGAVEKIEQDLPGFFYAGNHKDGLSVGKALASGCNAADMVISFLGSSRKMHGSSA